MSGTFRSLALSLGALPDAGHPKARGFHSFLTAGDTVRDVRFALFASSVSFFFAAMAKN